MQPAHKKAPPPKRTGQRIGVTKRERRLRQPADTPEPFIPLRTLRELLLIEDLSPSEKLVLLAIVAHKNRGEVSIPKYENLQFETGLGKRQLIRCIDSLEQMGVVQRRGKAHTGLAKEIVILALQGDNEGGQKGDTHDTLSIEEGDAHDTLFWGEGDIEGDIEGDTHVTPSNKVISNPPISPTGDDISAIYEAYPRKVGKAKAHTAIKKALTKVTPEALLEKVNQFAEATTHYPEEDRRFIPHPATWFNQGRWEDNPEEWKRTGPSTSKKPARDWSNASMEEKIRFASQQ